MEGRAGGAVVDGSGLIRAAAAGWVAVLRLSWGAPDRTH